MWNCSLLTKGDRVDLPNVKRIVLTMINQGKHR